jgi:hypothetical protein
MPPRRTRRIGPTEETSSDHPSGGVGGERPWEEPAVVASVETRRIPDAALPADAKGSVQIRDRKRRKRENALGVLGFCSRAV